MYNLFARIFFANPSRICLRFARVFRNLMWTTPLPSSKYADNCRFYAGQMQKSKKVIHNLRNLIHILVTIQQYTTYFSHVEKKSQRNLSTILQTSVYKYFFKEKMKEFSASHRFLLTISPNASIICGYSRKRDAPLAQLDRALVYGTKG